MFPILFCRSHVCLLTADAVVYFAKKINSNVLTVCDIFMMTRALQIGVVSGHVIEQKSRVTVDQYNRES